MSRPLITLTTDFGEGSPYVAQMKGAILSVNRNVEIIDVTHSIRPQCVLHGALVLADVWRCFPAGAIHVAVIDPGVGTQRELVGVQYEDCSFVLPDNGLLTGILQTGAPLQTVRLSNSRYHRPEISNTFHGRDIMGPVAAHLSRGAEMVDLGEALADLTKIDLPKPKLTPHRILGEVLMVDSFGNLITNIERGLINQPDVEIWLGDRPIGRLVATYGERSAGQPVALVGSTNRLEIAVVNGDAARALGGQEGDEVRVTW